MVEIQQEPTSNPRPLIHSYGLFWERDQVDWGAGRRAGHLKGVNVKAKRGGGVDFRDQKGIYALYDHDFNLVYVGQAGRGQKGKEGNRTLFDRLRSHNDGPMRARWTYFSWFGTLKHIDKDTSGKDAFEEEKEGRVDVATTLDELEGILIMAADPLLNRQGAKFKKAQEYKQDIVQPIQPIAKKQFEEALDARIKKLEKALEQRFGIRQ